MRPVNPLKPVALAAAVSADLDQGQRSRQETGYKLAIFLRTNICFELGKRQPIPLGAP
jgi:hypothetical protein